MLVVTANWAFTDGTLAATAATARAARGWMQDVRLAAIRAGFRGDGLYRPPAGLDIVLAGDTFDCLASAAWSGRDRPWRANGRAAEARQSVMVGCARRAAPLLAGLARLARTGLSAPAADRRGRPDPTRTVRIPARVALLPGDRDLHVAEAAAVIEARGATVAPAWSDEAVLVAHGHELDPTRHVTDAPAGDDRPPTLAESLAVDFVVPLAVGLARAGLPRSALGPLVAALAGADAVDFAAVFAAWFAGDGPGGALDPATRREVAAAWNRAVDGWLRSARRERPDCGLSASPLEPLAAWLGARGALGLPGLLEELRAGPPAAFTRTDRPRWVVLGHPPVRPIAGTAVCLGSPPVRRWGPVAVVRGSTATDVACVAPLPPAAAATVLCRRDGERRHWRWLTGAQLVPGVAVAPGAVVDAA